MLNALQIGLRRLGRKCACVYHWVNVIYKINYRWILILLPLIIWHAFHESFFLNKMKFLPERINKNTPQAQESIFNQKKTGIIKILGAKMIYGIKEDQKGHRPTKSCSQKCWKWLWVVGKYRETSWIYARFQIILLEFVCCRLCLLFCRHEPRVDANTSLWHFMTTLPRFLFFKIQHWWTVWALDTSVDPGKVGPVF